ncbi:unnamed protein product [Prunus brigantina]
MRKFSDHGFVLLVLLLAAIPFCFCINSTASCVERDREALIKFQQSFQDTPDGFFSWKGKDCCKWKGVSCDDQSAGHVVKLDLRAKRLRTQVDFQATEVSLSCLLELKYLKYLDLSGNNLGDGPIPKFFGSMKQLTYLNLSSAQFSGTVPHHLGNLTSLQILDLSNQPLLIVDDLRWLSRLSSLHHLDMSDLYLEETLNLMQVLSMLPSLLWLRLSNCGLNENQFRGGGTNATFLHNLQSLDLANNGLLGPIPDALRNMTSLRRLDLSFNILQSSIPAWLGNLENLIHLNLSHNVFNSIEGGLLSILRNPCHLKSLDLSLNPFQGEILGTSGTLSGCTEYDLGTLRLVNSGASGHLPDWLGKLRNLKYLDFQMNSFSGPIPFSLGNLSTLRELYLSHNQLNGTVPESLGQLSNLTILDLSSNNIDGIVSEVHFANLSKLEILNFALNHLTIEVKSNWEPPFQLKHVRMESCKFGTQFPQWLLTQKTITLDLSNASISGMIPKSLHGLHLTYLDLSYNEITGSLPQKISDMMPRLDSLFLGSNHIKGSVPTSLCNIETLGALDLSKNRLSGEIPGCLKNLQNLYAVDLSSNNLSGVIPSSVGYLRHLVWLNLNDNSLHGELPSALRNCSYLKHLDLGKNRLSGHIPAWIGDSFEFLIILRLRRNTFNGSIPSQLCQLSPLQVLDLAHNDLTGIIPHCFDYLKGMQLAQYSTNQPESDQQGYDIDAEPNNKNIWQVLKGREYESARISSLGVSMDLSSNNLVGFIPEELTSLSGLLGLNLSHNHLEGSIPQEIGELKSLESFDISNNQLSGTIPMSMWSLATTTLSHLNLSYNNLSGPLPKVYEVQPFDSTSFTGNSLLCGAPLPKNCPGDDELHQIPTSTSNVDHDSEEDRYEKLWFCLVVMLGFAMGFWGVLGPLMLNRSWRHAYFQYVDEAKDWIFVAVAVKMRSWRRWEEAM